jgi:histidinol dehydrogenase
MAKILLYPSIKQWEKVCIRPSKNKTDEKLIKNIFSKVRLNGDEALIHYTRQFDKVHLSGLSLHRIEIQKAAKKISPQLKNALKRAYDNIHRFHAQTFKNEKGLRVVKSDGLKAWRESKPISKVGLYIPGGNAPLFSTVLMLCIPAHIAGCEELVICTPPSKEGGIHPAMAYAFELCGVEKVFLCGGTQAIAAMAYGTESVPKVYKIFGPGNAWVTAAKMYALQQGLVAIDMPAGPSEVLVIADEFAKPDWVAADLLSQCEHGPDSQAILLTTSENFAKAVQKAARGQLLSLPENSFAHLSWKNSVLAVVKNTEECIRLSNIYAPEHLIIQSKDVDLLRKKVMNAGSVFLGPWSTEPLGDYITGPNHTLPTAGHAAAWTGISVESFMKSITFQEVTNHGIQRLGTHAMEMALAEGLPAHAQAIKIRLISKNKS